MQRSDTLSIHVSPKTEISHFLQSLAETKSYTFSHRIIHIEITTIFYEQRLHYLFCYCLFCLIILFRGNKRSDEASPGSPNERFGFSDENTDLISYAHCLAIGQDKLILKNILDFF